MNRRLQRGLQATFLGLSVNALLAAGKMVAGILGHSQALIADAVESLADIVSSIIVWRGLVLAAAPADAEHPYGHGKAEPLAAAAVAVILLVAAVGIAAKSASEMLSPHHSPAPFTLIVLVVVVVIKESLFRFVHKEGDTLKSSAVQSDAWHHRSDAITSLAAAIGISVALIGGPRYASADDVAAIAAAAMIAFNGLRLLRPAMGELMDASPGRDVLERIGELARGVSGVHTVEKCLVRRMGYQYLVDMHIEVDPRMTVEDAHLIAHQVKDHIRSGLPNVRDVLVHIEPITIRRQAPLQQTPDPSSQSQP